MEEKTTQRPRRVIVSEGKLLIMTEVPFKEGEPRTTMRFFSAFDGNAAKFAIIALKARIERCLSSLTKNVGEATRVTDMVVEWEDGYFSIPAYTAMEEVLERGNLQEMTRYSAIQTLKAIRRTRFNDVRSELFPIDREEFENIAEYIFNVFCEIALTTDKQGLCPLCKEW